MKEALTCFIYAIVNILFVGQIVHHP